MTEAKGLKVGIPMDLIPLPNHGGFVASAGGISTDIARTSGAAKARLAGLITVALKERADREREKRALVVCRDGTVMILNRVPCSGWTYTISREPGLKGRPTGGSCYLPGLAYDAAILKVRDHAIGSFGGVAWEEQR